jgi:GMP synthase-like glutamine amidotransferase
MNIYAVQHVPFEGLGCIADWVESHGSTTTMIRMYAQDPFPAISAIDVLVVLGGPMSSYQEREYPWLVEEKRFIREVIDAGKTVLGICLGAQLIADVLGAKVSPNSYKEIGWFTIDFTDEARACPLLHFEQMPQTMAVFHWHGDTFDVPKGALLLASSEACRNQGFVYDGGRVIAFQFHIEMKHENIAALIDHCGHEIDTNLPYVTSASEMLAHSHDVARVNAVMLNLLNRLQTN